MRVRPSSAAPRAFVAAPVAVPATSPSAPPQVAGEFEQVVVADAAMLAFPAGRHAALSMAPARVTVCVPVLNGGARVQRCLDSIGRQRYRDFDLLIVDNGSDDETLSIACAAAAKDARTIVYQNATNLGRVPNWNRCLDLARGEFVKFVMVNDYLLDDALQDLVAAMDANPDVAVARGSLTLQQAGGTFHFTPLFDASGIFDADAMLRHSVEQGNPAAGPTAQLLRRDVIAARSLRFNAGMSWAADYELAVQLFESGGMAYVRKPLYVFDETAQRHYGSGNLTGQLVEEFEVRVRTVARNRALFVCPDAAIARCAALLVEYAQRTGDTEVQRNMVQAFELTRDTLRQICGVPLAIAPSSPVKPQQVAMPVIPETAISGVRDDDLQLPVTPAEHPGWPRRVCIVARGVTEFMPAGDTGAWAEELAITLARAGHEVTLAAIDPEARSSDARDHWVGRYAAHGVRLHVLTSTPVVPFHGSRQVITTHVAYEWLKTEQFDVVHFSACEGVGYYATLAKHQGLAFGDTQFCVTVRDPHLFRKHAAQEYLTAVQDIEVDFIERQSVALADVVITPSRFMLAWLREHGWSLPKRCFVQQSLVRPVLETTSQLVEPSTHGAHQDMELVFTDALHDRSALALACDALDQLATTVDASFRVTFLHDRDRRETGAGIVVARAQSWGIEVQVQATSDREETLARLRGDRSMVVLTSQLQDASDMASACTEHGVPFVAADAGRVAEVVHADDVAHTCCARTAAALAARLADVLHVGARRVRHRVPQSARLVSWIDFHASVPSGAAPAATRPSAAAAEPLPLVTVCITHFNRASLLRQAVASMEAQDYPNLELLIVDDGSTDPTALAYLAQLERESSTSLRPWRVVRQSNQYLGAARNTGARHARGDFIAFHDDDDIAKPHRISTQVAVAMRTRADVVLAGMDQFTGNEPPAPDQVPHATWIAVGASLALGTFQNCYGAVHALVRRTSFLTLGGFREVVNVGHEDWEFWGRAVAAGLRLELVPEALTWYRLTPGSMLKTTSQYQNDMLSLPSHLAVAPAELRPALQLAFGMMRERTSHAAVLREHAATFTSHLLSAAKFVALGMAGQGAELVMQTLRAAGALGDPGEVFRVLCDGGVLLAGSRAEGARGVELLTGACTLARTANLGSAKLQEAESLLSAASAQTAGTDGNSGRPEQRPAVSEERQPVAVHAFA